MSDQNKTTVKNKIALAGISGAELLHNEGGVSFAIQKSLRDESADDGWKNFNLYLSATELPALIVVAQKLLDRHTNDQLH